MRENKKKKYFWRMCFISDKRNNLIHCNPSPAVVDLFWH